MLMPETAVVSAILLCLAGAGVTWLAAPRRRLAGWLAFGFTLASALLVFSATASVLWGGAGHPHEYLRLPALGFALRIYVDGLSAWFLMLVALVALPSVFYSIAYLDHYPSYSPARYYPYLMLFLAAMYGLVSTTDMMWFFFIFWQLMTLPGYTLIRFESHKPENLRAARKYFVMMQLACALTMIGAEMLAVGSAQVGGDALKYDFDSISANLPVLLETRSGLVMAAFAMFLTGFGIKLGMWPFGQIWLPDAHPAAPSPVSAMLSGVMIKTGVYGLMRYFLWLVPAGAQDRYPVGAWGLWITALGTITLLTGTAQALKQNQTKRLLAFSSIGQAGYILFGLGTALVLLSAPASWRPLAAVAFCGALLHTLNHGLFKSLLFLNAGSILWATDTQDLNRLGGLMRHMPWTALTALVASFAISGVPLLNGFVSKWILFVAAIQGSGHAGFLAFCAVIAMLTSGLTLATFVKFFGASFLTRTSATVQARLQNRSSLEVGWLMRAPQFLLAGFVILLGLLPAIGFVLVSEVLKASQQGLGFILAEAAPAADRAALGGIVLPGGAAYIPMMIGIVLGLMFMAAFVLSRLGRAQRRVAPPWLCGYDQEADHHRYRAHHLYGEIKPYFRWTGRGPESPFDRNHT